MIASTAMAGGLIAQQIGSNGLSQAQQSQLQRDKILFLDKSYRQIFEPYVFSDKPVFITADSVLNAWHVLFEESIRVMEERFSSDLPYALDKALAAIPAEAPEGMTAETYEKASRRAKLTLGVASKLSGGKWSGGKELDDLIAADVRQAEEAKGISLPEWLRGDSCGIAGFDYATFRPVGFYSGNPGMERYFRAVRWLQTVPFDLKREDHAAAMALVIAAFEDSRTVFEISEAFGELLGDGDSLDARMLTDFPNHSYPFRISDWLDSLKRWANEEEFTKAVAKPAVVLAARAMPDVDLFNLTTNEKRRFPDALEAAVLFGSPLAERLLEHDKQVIPVVSEARKQWLDGRSIYRDYAACLSELFDHPEPEAPDFMKSEAWQRKCLNTSLAGWAQFRHTWSLQGKVNVHFFGLVDNSPVGFVEPNPEFYRHLASLSARLQKFFANHQERPLSSIDVSRKAEDLIPLIRATIEPKAKMKQAIDKGLEPTKEVADAYQDAMREACKDLGFFEAALGEAGGSLSCYGDNTGFHVTAFSDPVGLLELMQKIAKGEGINEVMVKLEPVLRGGTKQDRWVDLMAICHDLETLAHKQLRGVAPENDEVNFIRSYGEKLANVMFYGGNSWLAPKDDAPRVTAVFNQPGEGFLMAGIGKPQEIRVLYPWKGREIECFGAVMPFREMRSSTNLTDVEWKNLLQSPSKPETPAWLKPVTSPQ